MKMNSNESRTSASVTYQHLCSRPRRRNMDKKIQEKLSPYSKQKHDVRYHDQFGGELYFKVIEHNKDLCKEFVVVSPKFSFLRWAISTAILNLSGFLLNLHRQSSWLMTGVIFLLVILLLLKLHSKVKQESLLVMASLGVQLTTKFATGRTQATFYQSHQVVDIVINEAISMHRVMFYLTILLRDSQASNKIGTLIPLFQQTWPSLRCLREIYRGVHQVLDFGQEGASS